MHFHIPQSVMKVGKRAKKEKRPELQQARTSSSSGTRSMFELSKTETGGTKIGRFVLRGKNDDLPQSWWFASTAIPLLAATIGPLANILSIAAIVTSWRSQLDNDGVLPEGSDALGVGIPDPKWEIILNAVSLACGFVGNFFLLCNFTKRIRYIISLPMSIICWFFATGILTGIVIAMHIYAPPISPGQTYSQGYWHAVLASILYMIGAVSLMVNMLGYFLGKYPQHFELDDSQRTLIIQTMLFFFWLAAGAGIFSRICGWSYADAMYFCDVTVLTIGYGDFVAPNDAGRGFVFPYTVIGIVFLGLMINSISKFAGAMSKDKVIKAHALHERARTLGRTVTNEKELRDRLGLPPRRESDARRPSDTRRASAVRGLGREQRLESLSQYGHFKVEGRTITFHEHKSHGGGGRGGAGRGSTPKKPLSRDEKIKARKEGGGAHAKRADRRQKLIMLKEEKDRFDAMREIEKHTHKFKQYYALAMSLLAFSILLCAGAVVFMLAESREQGLSYFQSLYFCYVSLLTIGYGDFSPRSNVGKSFFVVWSLIAVPTMTILISDLGDTVVAAMNRQAFSIADWTVMPREGAWHDFLIHHPKVKKWLEGIHERIEARKRLKEGFAVANPDMDIEGDADSTLAAKGRSRSTPEVPNLEQLAREKALSDHDLARKLALAIKRAAQDLHLQPPKKYRYEEWVEFTRLIRFSAENKEEVEEEEEEEGIIEWDWIGENSPMLSDMSESEWILDRLCESLNRYTRKQARRSHLNPTSPNRERKHFVRRLSTEKEEEEGASTGSGSGGSNSNEKDEHWHGLGGGGEEQEQQQQQTDHQRGDGPRKGLVKLHNSTESEAVREWEARIKKDREEAKRKRDEEKHAQDAQDLEKEQGLEHENEKEMEMERGDVKEDDDEIKPH